MTISSSQNLLTSQRAADRTRCQGPAAAAASQSVSQSVNQVRRPRSQAETKCGAGIGTQTDRSSQLTGKQPASQPANQSID